PLRETHGWSNAVVSGATGLYFSVGGVTGALVGAHIDRHGPLRLQLVGVLMLAGSVALVGSVTEPWQLFLLYTVLAVGFGMSSNVAVNAIVSRWFIVRRAKAMSIAATGISVGGVVLVPIGTALVESGGLQRAGPVLALVVLALALPMVLLVLVWDPAQMGLRPDDGAAPVGGGASLSDTVQLRPWTRRQAARTVAFWAILVGFGLVLMAQTGFVIHQISFLTERFDSANAAAAALSVTALGSIVARLIVGHFADAWDKRLLAVSLLVIQASAVTTVVFVDHPVVTYAMVLVVGFTIGNIYMMQSLLVGDTFGLVSFGTIFGLVGVVTQTASGVGPLAVGWLEDLAGGYHTPFLVTAAVTYAAAAILTLARPPAAEPTR
ncbi:MAG: MFS transporter, partial [Acidimicrobiales bacterium]